MDMPIDAPFIYSVLCLTYTVTLISCHENIERESSRLSYVYRTVKGSLFQDCPGTGLLVSARLLTLRRLAPSLRSLKCYQLSLQCIPVLQT
jgi:hypothetical protein